MLYCDLVDTGKIFNNKKIYKCQKCDLEAGLEDPNAKILCFAKSTELYKSEMTEMNSLLQDAYENDEEMKNASNFHDPGGLPPEVDANAANPVASQQISQATEEQINSRMDICNSCEYYKDDACMLCGCRVVRDTVYQNKLADKSASCPDGRWGPIKD